jgi:hypothetical protein
MVVTTGQRELNRDSLFLMAEVRLDGVEGEHRVRVRNLSAGGMMADGDVKASRGQSCQVSLRNLGWIDGTVAWVQDGRFGVAFREEIDPKEVRAPVVQGDSTPSRFRSPAQTSGELRKI